MKKCYQIIIFFAILAYFNSETLKCDGEIHTNREDCWNLFTDEQREYGYYCCYLSGKKSGDTKTQCQMLSEEEIKYIDDVKSDFQDAGYTDVVIDCNTDTDSNSNSYSYYLQSNILLLLLILL